MPWRCQSRSTFEVISRVVWSSVGRTVVLTVPAPSVRKYSFSKSGRSVQTTTSASARALYGHLLCNALSIQFRWGALNWTDGRRGRAGASTPSLAPITAVRQSVRH